VSAPFASGLGGTGSEIGMTAGHAGRRVTRWRAAWLPPGAQVAAGGRPGMGAGHR